VYLTKHTYYDISNSGGDYMDYYSSIKELLINNELTKKAKDYSDKLFVDIGKKYEVSTLKRMRQ